jgi:hypothetical protein
MGIFEAGVMNVLAGRVNVQWGCRNRSKGKGLKINDFLSQHANFIIKKQKLARSF